MLKGIVYLSIGHSPRVKPNVDEILFARHHLTRGRDELDLVYHGTVKVNFFVVFVAIIAWSKALERIAFHHSRSNRLFYGLVELFYRCDTTLFGAIFTSPNVERRTPESAT